MHRRLGSTRFSCPHDRQSQGSGSWKYYRPGSPPLRKGVTQSDLWPRTSLLDRLFDPVLPRRAEERSYLILCAVSGSVRSAPCCYLEYCWTSTPHQFHYARDRPLAPMTSSLVHFALFIATRPSFREYPILFLLMERS